MLDLHVKSRFCGGGGVRGGPIPTLFFSINYIKYIYHLQLKENALQCLDLSENDQEPLPHLETDHLDSLLMTDEIILGFIMQG